ncbi:MAG: hypothetical protein ABFS37_04315 [Acidobacteriota bacterium]
MTEIVRFRTAFMLTDPTEAERHLSEQQWESLACGELDQENHEAALDHILGCRRCAEIHQSLLVLRENAHTFDPGAPVPNVARKSSSRGWIFSGMLAVAATLLVIVFRPVGPDLTNSGPPAAFDPVLRSSQWEQSATPLSPVGQTSMSRVVFSWTSSPTAPVSIVQLIDGHGEVVWTSQETEANTLDWPDNIAPSPGRHYWRVLSFGGAAGGQQASDLVAFDLSEFPSGNPG